MQNLNIFKDLWNDERGAVVTSELVLLGTVGVVGATVGAQKVSKALNEEMIDMAHAIRSLDQSYCIPQRCSLNGAWTAGSSFKQVPVEQALRDLGVEETPPPGRRSSSQEEQKEQEKSRGRTAG